MMPVAKAMMMPAVDMVFAPAMNSLTILSTEKPQIRPQITAVTMKMAGMAS